jgi:hypothetical protein
VLFIFQEAAHGGEFEMRMRVNEAGQDHCGPVIGNLRVGKASREFRGRADAGDLRILDRDRAVFNCGRGNWQDPTR